MSEEKKDKEDEKEKKDHLESFVKYVGIFGGLIAAFVGIYQLWQSNVQSARELRWKQAELGRQMVDKMMADEGWKAMEMMDWDDEGRDYEINGHKENLTPMPYIPLWKRVRAMIRTGISLTGLIDRSF